MRDRGSRAPFSFNPWKGFGGFGTMFAPPCLRVSSVSIPGRDLGVLEPMSAITEFKSTLVSIPGRDLGVLELE